MAVGPNGPVGVHNPDDGRSGVGTIIQLLGQGIEAQTRLALANLDAILTAAGASMATLVKATIFYRNLDDFATINDIYASHMPDPPPARSAPANVLLPRGLLISIDAIAVVEAG
jgi:2-iminobutanoate/2-iminopropanoate deaminase